MMFKCQTHTTAIILLLDVVKNSEIGKKEIIENVHFGDVYQEVGLHRSNQNPSKPREYFQIYTKNIYTVTTNYNVYLSMV